MGMGQKPIRLAALAGVILGLVLGTGGAGSAASPSGEGKEIKVRAELSCDDGTAVFRVTNLGPRWPAMADIVVYRVKDHGQVSRRALRMGEDQNASFRVREASTMGELGIRVEPTWYERQEEWDARGRCE